MRKKGKSTKQKTDRNTLIVQQLEQGKTLTEVASMFGLKAKSTISHIYSMAKIKGKYGVRKLSTDELADVRN